MNYFRQDNTDGFTEHELDQMNTMLALAMQDVDTDDPNYGDILKNRGEKIINDFPVA